MRVTKKETEYINHTAKSRYIQLDPTLKGFEQSALIVRYWNLLNRIAPNKYSINFWDSLASITDKETGLSEITFSRQVIPTHWEELNNTRYSKHSRAEAV